MELKNFMNGELTVKIFNIFNPQKDNIEEILPDYSIKSVIDIGCGARTWLKAWQEINNEIEIIGVEVNNLDSNILTIPRQNIIQADITQPNIEILTNRKFDILESLEVAEHIEEKFANQYIKLLTSYSDCILFSAALPNQTRALPVNEQPPQYWNEKFKKYGYECFDILRNKLWNNENICWWHRQNIMIYAKNEIAKKFKKSGFIPTEYINTYYHPELIKLYV